MHLLRWELLEGDEDHLEIRLEQDVEVSAYAILSHRWGNQKDEVSFEDMLSGRPEEKKGYAKLMSCCKQARRDGFDHVWIDTCCINKASSAHLSESITSMFSYYEQARVCYVFLDDVSMDSTTNEIFSHSKWFCRGWTLQELIAPLIVNFFDKSWNFLGTKTDESLSLFIQRVTNVDLIVLNAPKTMKLVSVAKRMSWAARRKTTRKEDVAYSLMGIFGVYMPPLYGEGSHAFVRLQETIMRNSNDHTIFAWTSPPVTVDGHGFEYVSTMLALSPAQFEESSNFVPLSHREHSKRPSTGPPKLDYAATNTGLAIRLPLLKIDEAEGLYAAFLACADDRD